MGEARDIWGETAEQKAAWFEGFERASSSGPTCLTCGALVPNMGDGLQRHRDWHAEIDRRLDGR